MPSTAANADRSVVSPAANSRHRRRLALWVPLGLTVLLLGVLSVTACAQPNTTAPPGPCIGLECPRPVPNTSTPAPCPIPMQCTPTPPPGGSSTKTTPEQPCTGEDCIPQPTPPPPGGGGQPGPGGGEDSSDCGITDIGACISEAINAVFRGLVEAAVAPILDLLGHTVLSTPTLSDLPGIGELWNNSWLLVVAIYGLFVLIGGIVLMGYETVQTRYSIREIGPRLGVAFFASALSLFFVDKAIRLANALTQGVLGDGVGAPSLGSTLKDAIAGMATGGLAIILIALVLVVAGFLLLIVYAIRVVATIVLIVAGPLFLAMHALPHTDGLARWWWKAIAAVLAIQFAQALVLITAVRTVLSGAVHLFGSTLSAFGMLLAAIALFYILFRIPFWLLRAVKVGSGRSFLGGLVRAYVAAKTFGMVTQTAGRHRPSGSGSSSGGSTGTSGGGAGRGGDPPWPPVPQFPPTLAVVATRMKAAFTGQRAQAAGRSRLPSQAPRFLQPQPQQSTHDPAISTVMPTPTTPAFSSAPSSAAPVTSTGKPQRPQFQTTAAYTPPVPPIRSAAVPPQLRFQPATPEPPHTAQPVRPTTPAAPPAFRPATPPPKIGDAYKRTPSVPRTVFRPPPPRPTGGDKT